MYQTLQRHITEARLLNVSLQYGALSSAKQTPAPSLLTGSLPLKDDLVHATSQLLGHQFRHCLCTTPERTLLLTRYT
jgi:hypothetical protein